MRIAEFNSTCSLSRKDTRVTPVIVVIVIVVMYGTSLGVSGRAVLTLVITAVLTAAAEELVRAAELVL